MIKENAINKEIRTPELLIVGNAMSWKDTVIQLSNISSLTTVSLNPEPFPIVWIIVMILASVFLIRYYLFVSVLLWGFAGLLIYLWYKQNQQLAQRRNLRIMMNSGKLFVIAFNNKEFLKKVYGVLGSIIAEDSHSTKNVRISIENSTITGEASVLNNLML